MLRKIEKYELLDEIGHGGMATVYRARDSRLDRLVAVKVMHPHLRGAGEARVRFAREAQSVARLRHGNILEIYDNSSEQSDEGFIVTELLTGPTLKAFAEAHADIPAEIAACFGIELARALGAAHAAGVVHRDVKPENVLLHEARCIKLTDFGIAQMVDSQSFTATGQILGSPGHMAPEQVEGGHCDARTDLFSLGTVLYYLATGTLPYTGRNPHQILKRIVDGEFTDPLRVRPAIGGRMRAIILRALARDPAARYQTAAELEADLVAFVRAAGLEDPTKILAEYLHSPAETAARMHRELVPRLISAGEAAVARRDVPLAIDHFNRALAIDEKNSRVLAAVARLSNRGRVRRQVLAFGIGLGVFGLAAILYAALAGSNAGVADARSSGNLADPRAGHSVLRPELASFPAHDRSSSAKSPTGQQREPNTHRPSSSGMRDAATDRGPRHVLLSPVPRNVTISVDGAPPRPFGPSFQALDIAPGPHRFRVEAAGRCCEPLETTRAIPAGRGDFTVELALAYRPASLLVRTNVPADLVVDDGAVRDRTNDVVLVPMERPERPVTLRVTAPGHRSYTGNAWLRAGELQTQSIELVPEASGSAP